MVNNRHSIASRAHSPFWQVKTIDHFNIAARTNGKRVVIAIHIYPTEQAMITAGNNFHSTKEEPLSPETAGITNAYWDYWQPQAIIRYCHQRMNQHILIHELIHAAQIAYRWTAPNIEAPATEHFTHYNEDFAHLVSDLYLSLQHELGKRYTIT